MVDSSRSSRTLRGPLAASVLIGGVLCAVSDASHAAGEHYDAAMNYRLHCEGCHQQDGSGQPGYIPDLRGNVSRFLAIPEGRVYLARVPGTAQSLLSDTERAEVLNYIVRSFDRDHLPVDFTPYHAEELAKWRYDALSQPSVVRASLVAQLEPSRSSSADAPAKATGTSATSPATSGPPAASGPPASFVICAACHPVTSDGAPGIGPNLHGVVGRHAGTAAGFSYSPAMKDAKITWSRETLDEYLTSPGAKVPGNYMMFVGEPDPQQRKAIIDYLESLR